MNGLANMRRVIFGLCLLLLLFKVMPVLADSVPVVTAQQTIMADFEQPTSVALDAQERLFVVDGGKHRVVVLGTNDQVQFSFGNDAEGLQLPMDLSIAGDRVAVADSGNKRILIYNLQGQLQQTITPSFTQQPKRKYQEPRPVAVLLQDDTLYWSDQANHQICWQLLSDVKAQCFGQRGETDDDFQYPFQIVRDSGGYLHILDVINARVKVTNKKGKFISTMGKFGVNEDELFRPNGLAIDAQDVVYVADNYFGSISLFKGGQYLGKLQDQQGKVLRFNSPAGLYWHANELYVVDSPVHKVYRLDLGQKPLNEPVAASAKQRVEISQKNCVVCHLEWTDEHSASEPKREPVVKAVASSKMCYSCHNGIIMDSRLLIQHGEQHPSVDDREKDKITLKHMQERKDKMPKEFPLTAEQEMLCTSCHTPHNSADHHETLHDENHNAWLRVSAKDGDLCERCHESKAKNAREREAEKRGLNHPLAIKFAQAPEKDHPDFVREEKLQKGLPSSLKQLTGALDSSSQLICQSCHQVHGGFSNELLTVSQEKGELCVQCHDTKNSKDKKDARHLGIHPVNEKLEKPITRKQEKITQVQCQSCHKVHSGSIGTPLLPNAAKTPDDICADCHKRQTAENKKDAHHKGVHPLNFKIAELKLKEPIKFGKEGDKQELKEVTCSTCHAVHSGSPDTAALVNDVKKTVDICIDCHQTQQAKGRKDAHRKGVHPVNFDIAELKLKEPLKFGQEVLKEINCMTCHSVHKGSPETAVLHRGPDDPKQGSESFHPSANVIEKTLDICVDCHKRQQAKNKADARHKGVHPVNFKLDEPLKFGKGEVKEINCMTCHSVHQGSPNTSVLHKGGVDAELVVKDLQKTEDICVDCHKRESAKNKDDARLKGVHPVNFKLEQPLKFGKEEVKQITCTTCHAVHKGSPNTPMLVNNVKEVEELCVDCHKRQHAKDKDDAIAKSIHPAKGKLEEPVEINGKKIKTMGCLSCHSIHQQAAQDVTLPENAGKRPADLNHGANKNTPALVLPYKNGELCENCHAQKQAVVGSDHDLRITAKDRKNHYDQLPQQSGVCGSCHSMHQHEGKETVPKLHLDAVKAVKNLPDPKRDEVLFKEDALCLNCHQKEGVGKEKKILHFKHPYKDMILRSDKKVMPLLDKQEKVKEFGAIACITCHDPHLWKALAKDEQPEWTNNTKNIEGNMLNSFLRHKDVKGTFCVSCHGLETLPKYKYFHDESLVRNIGVDYLH